MYCWLNYWCRKFQSVTWYPILKMSAQHLEHKQIFRLAATLKKQSDVVLVPSWCFPSPSFPSCFYHYFNLPTDTTFPSFPFASLYLSATVAPVGRTRFPWDSWVKGKASFSAMDGWQSWKLLFIRVCLSSCVKGQAGIPGTPGIPGKRGYRVGLDDNDSWPFVPSSLSHTVIL